ncbi:hypothetical protein KM043_000043 [Ampulex compressa]|nr:hypothetical protein KM043_000043 [Ampulex compressa]
MSSVNYYLETVKQLWKAVQAKDAEAEDYVRWLDILKEAIKALRLFMLRADLDRSERQRCQSYMSHFLFIQNKLNGFLRFGGAVQQQHQLDERGVVWQDIQSAFNNRIRTGVIINRGHLDVISFMNAARPIFKVQIKLILNKYTAIKVNTELTAEFIIQKSGEESISVKYFHTKNGAIYRSTDLTQWFEDNIRQPTLKEMEEFQERDSGWSLKAILGLTVNINKLNPLKGSSYIVLPSFIADKKACVNVQNNDNKCFKWAILSALFPTDVNPYRVNNYQDHANDHRFKDLKYPMQPKDISKFETSSNISINLYILNKYGRRYEISPCHVTSQKRDNHVNLLLIQNFYIDESLDNPPDDDETDYVPKFHYVWIKNMSRLIGTQVSTHQHKCHVCNRCLHFFHSEEKLEAHEDDCSQVNTCRIDLPTEKNKILQFQNHDRSELVPFVIYADLESVLKPMEDERIIQEHVAYSIGFYVKCSFDESRSIYKSYRKMVDDDLSPAEWLVKQLQALSADLEERYKNAKEMRLTDYEAYSFFVAKTCHICRKTFKDSDRKVRDHCHLTGR